jgi:hypothetical protein
MIVDFGGGGEEIYLLWSFMFKLTYPPSPPSKTTIIKTNNKNCFDNKKLVG